MEIKYDKDSKTYSFNDNKETQLEQTETYMELLVRCKNLEKEVANSIPISLIEKIIKEKIEWCIKASNSGLNAIQYACSKEDEIERIERQKNISTTINILKEMLQELLDERSNIDD